MAVLGLGYVGRPLALGAAAAGYEVLGFDPAQRARESAEKAHRGGHGGFRACADPAQLGGADTWLICVPTPLDARGRPDLTAVRAALGIAARGLSPGALVCLVSTCQPGATNGLCRSVLEAAGWRIGRDVFLAVSPERENPGPHAPPTRSIPRLLGATDPASLRRALAFWRHLVDRVEMVASPEVAECAKLLENTYRLVNIALMDELHAAFTALGVPTRDVVAAAATKPFGFSPFWPGLGAGGHCIPVDPAFLQMEAVRAGAPSALLAKAMARNRGRVARVLAQIRARLGDDLAGKRVLVAGVTYKPDVADLRAAAPLRLLRHLHHARAELAWHDPVLSAVPKALSAIPRSVALKMPDGAQPEAIILGTPHRAFDLVAITRAAPLVFDPFGILPPGPNVAVV
ncbi:MAG: nucleotide sugar dehydrogenase [Roseomonas sp.]|nr:nucleotide sugar dehydrogenase [Roseomonas sp.]MCA3369627.1 nucleotide sugar dehydrogenase [Roseomonas sp.]